VRLAIESEKSVLYPASALQVLPNARFYITQGAAKNLMERRLHALQQSERISDRDVERCIIDLAVVLVLPDGRRETHTFRINPEMPIPEDSSRIHGIHDADVAGCPTFRDIAPRLCELLADCDLAGYNMVRFDLVMLMEEFQRVGIDPGRRPETLTPAEFGALSVELGRSRRSAADV
jgi:hypothetical protein